MSNCIWGCISGNSRHLRLCNFTDHTRSIWCQRHLMVKSNKQLCHIKSDCIVPFCLKPSPICAVGHRWLRLLADIFVLWCVWTGSCSPTVCCHVLCMQWIHTHTHTHTSVTRERTAALISAHRLPAVETIDCGGNLTHTHTHTHAHIHLHSHLSPTTPS